MKVYNFLVTGDNRTKSKRDIKLYLDILLNKYGAGSVEVINAMNSDVENIIGLKDNQLKLRK